MDKACSSEMACEIDLKRIVSFEFDRIYYFQQCSLQEIDSILGVNLLDFNDNDKIDDGYTDVVINVFTKNGKITYYEVYNHDGYDFIREIIHDDKGIVFFEIAGENSSEGSNHNYIMFFESTFLLQHYVTENSDNFHLRSIHKDGSLSVPQFVDLTKKYIYSIFNFIFNFLVRCVVLVLRNLRVKDAVTMLSMFIPISF